MCCHLFLWMGQLPQYQISLKKKTISGLLSDAVYRLPPNLKGVHGSKGFWFLLRIFIVLYIIFLHDFSNWHMTDTKTAACCTSCLS